MFLGVFFIRDNARNNQLVAILILIPMLIFTFFVTIKSEGFTPVDDSEQIIHKYFILKNERDIDSLSSLLTTYESISILESQLKYLDKISLIYIKEETNESILNSYLKNNNSISPENLKVYKVNYEVSYNDSAPDSFKNGVYESWFFLTRKNVHSQWLIDI